MIADKEENSRTKPSGALSQLSTGSPASGVVMQRRVMSKSAKTQTCPTFF